jgi:hypothetical protein
MSSSLLVACTSLISIEVLSSIVLFIALAMIANMNLPNPLSQSLRNDNGYFSKESSVSFPTGKLDLKHHAQSKQLSNESELEAHPNLNTALTNWMATGLKIAALFALLTLSPLGWSSTTRNSYGMPSCHFHTIKSFLIAGYPTSYPDLLDVGAEELVAGLESGAWTSVKLTKVCRVGYVWRSMLMNPGIHSSH